MGRKKKRAPRAARKTNSSELPSGFRRRLRRALPGLLLTLLMTVVLVESGVLYALESKTQDLLARYWREPPADTNVVVVMIDDNDYRQLFDGTSPLRPEKLKELIDAIDRGGPKVIGVDVSTSDHQFRERFRAEDRWRPIVWVNAVHDFASSAQDGEGLGTPVPREVLGGNGARPIDLAGMPTLLDDQHGVTRFYQRGVETVYGIQPSFAWAVVRKFLDPALAGEETPERRLIKYAGRKEGVHRRQFSASAAIALKDDPMWGSEQGIRDKIVLLGGNYLGADQHSTPLGQMNGANVLATVVETELSGGGVKEPGEYALVPLWALQGIVMVLVFQFFPLIKSPLQNLGLSLALVIFTSLVCSLIASRSLQHVGYFVPVALGVLALQILDYLNDWRKERLALLVGHKR